MRQDLPLGWLDCLFGLCGGKTETLSVARKFTFFTGNSNASENLGKINNLYRRTVKKVSEPFYVPVKNVKSRTTAKVSVLHRTDHQANVNILKANLGTLFL